MNEILVISTGLAPQVITEMLWWLAARDDAEPIVPDAIHVVTTRRGAEVIDAQVRGCNGKLEEFCKEFALPNLDERLHIHSPKETDPEYGDDARDLDTNIGYANRVTSLLRGLTADPETRVRACLAGGRKTMSFYLGYAMSLLGRSHDDLCHILVSPAFENSPDFWWKPKDPRTLHVGGSDQEQNLGIDEATIDVASIPFVRLRYLVDPALLDNPEGDVDFNTIVIGAQAGVERQQVTLTDADCEISIGGETVPLPPKKYALYRLLAEWRKAEREGAGPYGLGEDHHGWLKLPDVDGVGNPAVQRFLEIYENLQRAPVPIERRELRQSYEGMDPKELQREFNREVANTNRILRQKFDFYITVSCVCIQIDPGNPRGRVPRRFGLTFEPHQIEIIDDVEMIDD